MGGRGGRKRGTAGGCVHWRIGCAGRWRAPAPPSPLRHACHPDLSPPPPTPTQPSSTPARRSAALHARSAVKIQRAAAAVYAATIDDRVAVKIGPGDWSPDAAGVDVGQRKWELETSGPQYALWRAVFR